MIYQNFSARKVGSRGPFDAKILIVGEAPGEKEDEQGKPFVGPAGWELEKELSEARIIASACRYTNVIRYRPQQNDIDLAFASSRKKAEESGAVEHLGRYCLPVAMEGIKDLAEEIQQVRPALIIAVGGTALWATTGKEGIEDWRGSTLRSIVDPTIPVIPTYHPSAILHAWENRYLAVLDLKRANNCLQFGPTPAPPWHFRVRPDFATVMECLDIAESRGDIAVDIETKRQRIMCVGLAWDKFNAICIPFVRGNGTAYWSEEEEIAIVQRLRHILMTHRIIGQNFHYDAQYFAREMFVIPRCYYDTMLAQHTLMPGTPKSLAHNSSLYCPYHVFWKDDGKEWDPKLHPEEQLWSYNCVDCVKTFEVRDAQIPLITRAGLQPQLDFMMDMWPIELMPMLQGVRIDPKRKAAAADELQTAIAERQRWLNTVVGREFNPNSPIQMKFFLCDELGVKGRKGKKTKGISFDKKALHKIGEEHNLLWPFVQVIEEIRSLKVFLNTFALAPLDRDGRMRCSYNAGGTETFRLSSSENAFGSGTNLQNIPSGNRSTTMKMPNMRSMFIPDEGYEIAEIDLAGADAQVVAWECNDDRLKSAFRAGLKIHVVNNKDMYGHLAGPDGKAEPYYTRIKQGVHLTNYCGKARTMASTLGITVAESERFQAKWFGLHPNIPKWHATIEQELSTTRSVKNIWGFRRIYWERIETILPEAVAWKPQSTVAITINKIWQKLATAPKLSVDILLQVHDSLVFQYPIATREETLVRVRELVKVRIPYPDPLIIQLGLKTSTKSWGACEDRKWPEAHVAAELS